MVLTENSCLLIAWYCRLPFSGHSCDDSSITFPNWGWIQTLSIEESLIYGNLVLSYVCCQAIFCSHWSSVGETGLGIGFQTFDLFLLISHQVFKVLMFFHLVSHQVSNCGVLLPIPTKFWPVLCDPFGETNIRAIAEEEQEECFHLAS